MIALVFALALAQAGITVREDGRPVNRAVIDLNCGDGVTCSRTGIRQATINATPSGCDAGSYVQISGGSLINAGESATQAQWIWVSSCGDAGPTGTDDGGYLMLSTEATYWLAMDASIPGSIIMGSKDTGLVINHADSGHPTIYAGATCSAGTYPTEVSASGALTCGAPAAGGSGYYLTSNGTTISNSEVFINNIHTSELGDRVALSYTGTAVWTGAEVPSCSNAVTSKLLYSTTTHAFSCGTDQLSDGGAGAGGYATVQEEGSSLTARTTLNFVGYGMTCADNSGNSTTDCTVSKMREAFAADAAITAQWADTAFVADASIASLLANNAHHAMTADASYSAMGFDHDPGACSAGQYVSDMSSTGVLTCSIPPVAGVSSIDGGTNISVVNGTTAATVALTGLVAQSLGGTGSGALWCAPGDYLTSDGGGAFYCGTPSGAPSGAPSSASYWTRVAESGLSNETAMGALASGIVINATTTGVPTIYAGADCTDQFVRGLTPSGVLSCEKVVLNDDTSGTLAVANGGTGQADLGLVRVGAAYVCDAGYSCMGFDHAPGKCAANTYAIGVDSTGEPTCSQPAQVLAVVDGGTGQTSLGLVKVGAAYMADASVTARRWESLPTGCTGGEFAIASDIDGGMVCASPMQSAVFTFLSRGGASFTQVAVETYNWLGSGAYVPVTASTAQVRCTWATTGTAGVSDIIRVDVRKNSASGCTCDLDITTCGDPTGTPFKCSCAVSFAAADSIGLQLAEGGTCGSGIQYPSEMVCVVTLK